jgi:membrane-associated phospholipid phosphatase
MGRIQMHELRASLCSFFLSIGLTEGVTCTLKLYVSRHRPNFYALCEFDKALLKCMAPLSTVREATLSFPSGHSSLSFCAMTFLQHYLRGRVALITPSSSIVMGGRTIRLQTHKLLLHTLCCIVPWSYSFFVACSRVHDHWHNPSDVIAGSLLGITGATICYHAFYPSAGAPKAGIPLSLQQSNTSTE